MAKKQYLPDPGLWSQLRTSAHQLRTEQTEAERQLWGRLRGWQFYGYKFRRQHAINRFVVDFFCDEANLIIEIDGPIHQQKVVEDQERQEILESLGFQVLRFSNDQVMNSTPQVLAEILQHLTQGPSLQDNLE